MSDSNVEILKKGYVAFGKGDLPTVLSLFDPKIDWYEAESLPYGGRHIGHDAVVENVFSKLSTEWDGYTVSPIEYIDSGETIVVLGKYSGTFKETGKSMEADFAHVWRFSDGKAAKFYQYVDSLKLSDAMQG